MFSIFEQYPLGVKNPDGSLNSSESLRNAPNSAFLAADSLAALFLLDNLAADTLALDA